MALTLSASTFQRGTAFQVAILGAADRSRVVAFSSDGESLTTRPLFILGDDRHNFQVGWLLTGTYRATGTPTISLVEYPFNSTTGTTSAVATTVQAGAVTPTVALATFPYTGMGPFYAYVQDAPSATVAVNAFSSDGISVRAYPAFFAGTNRTTVGHILMGVLRFGGSPTINVLMRDRQGTNTSAIGLSLGGGGGTATAPAAPVIAVTAGNAQNSVIWTDGNDGGSAITARKLYRSTTSGFTPGPGNLIATSPTFPYADTGLTNGTAYYYKGIAANVIGDSAASTEQSGAPSAGALTLAQRGLPSVFQSGALPVSVTETSPQSGVFGSTYLQATFDTNVGTMYYVSAAGSDANDGLSSGAPKATLQAAVDAAATGNRITITTAGRYAPAVVLNKNLSIYGAVAGIYIGSFLANADVSSWGTLASGRQAVTLTTGTVSGFVDLTKNRRTDRQSNAIPQVSQVATTAAAIATLQTGKTTTAIELALYGTTIGTADPQAGVFRSTPSQIGASDARDLTNKFDTELLAWRSTAVSPLAATGTSQVFIKGVTFVGAQTTIALTAQVVYDTCRWLGSVDQCASITGIAVFYNCVGRGCAFIGADIIDYDAAAVGVEIGCFVDQCSQTGADNCSTQHGGTTLRINGTYLDAARCWSDGLVDAIVGGFGCTLGAAPVITAYSLNITQGEGHYAGITFINTGAYDIRVSNIDAVNYSCRGFFYDTSYVGKNIDLSGTTNFPPTARTTAKATNDAALATFDISNMASLYQTADTSTPVTTLGQPVVRINSLENAADFMVVTGGTYVYTDVSGKKCLRSTTTNTNNFMFRMDNILLEENCNIVIGLVSSDTTGLLMRNPSSPNFYGQYSSGNLNGTGLGTPGQRVNAASYAVDGAGSYTTATALKAAAFNGLPHVVSIKGADLGWLRWTKATNIMQIFDGDFYGIEISRATDAAALKVREQAMAAKNGATVP